MDYWASIAITLIGRRAASSSRISMTACILAVTIGTLALYQALALVVIGDQSISRPGGQPPRSPDRWVYGHPTMAIPVILFVILFWLLLQNTVRSSSPGYSARRRGSSALTQHVLALLTLSGSWRHWQASTGRCVTAKAQRRGPREARRHRRGVFSEVSASLAGLDLGRRVLVPDDQFATRFLRLLAESQGHLVCSAGLLLIRFRRRAIAGGARPRVAALSSTRVPSASRTAGA